MLPRLPEGLGGSFTAFIPRQLTTLELRLVAAPAEAVGFPCKITYTGLRPGLTFLQPRNFLAHYRPRFESFVHAGKCRKLTYSWASGGPFHVDVLHNRETGDWNIYKFNAGRLISHVCAQGYGEVMIRATKLGLEDHEPAFTFAGETEDCQRENRAQAEFARECEQPGAPAEISAEDLDSQVLVFGAVFPGAGGGGNLVFLPLEKAQELAAIHDALLARTWGEFKLNLPGHRLNEVLTTFLECGAWASFDLFYAARVQDGTRAERDALWQEYEALAPGERLPLDDDELQLHTLPGVTQGDWPEWPEHAMLRWLPPLIWGKFGRRGSTSLNRDFVVFDPRRAPEIIAALEAAGYSCRCDEALVRRLCGYR